MEYVTLEKTKEIAEKANLVLTQEELQRYHKELQSIFEYAKKLEEVNTDNVEPITITNGVSNVFRSDTIRPSLPIEKVLASSQKTEGNVFEVKAILE